MSSEFDARAYYATLVPPVFIDPTGKRHEGRIIGADTYFRLQAKMRSPMRADGTADHRVLEQALRTLVRAFFPHKWYNVRAKSVEHWLWQMPHDGRMRAIWSFMQSQATAMGVTMGQRPGTSPISTPQADAARPALPTFGSSPSSMSTSPASTTVAA